MQSVSSYLLHTNFGFYTVLGNCGCAAVTGFPDMPSPLEPFFFCWRWNEMPQNDLYISFAINCFLKNAGPTILLAQS
jgi:hypothetical protein